MLRLRAAWPRQAGVRLFSRTAAARDWGEEASYSSLAADRMRVIQRRRAPGQRFAFDRDDTPSLPVVFFDGGCPLCVREISHYKRLDRDGAVSWVDLEGEGDDFSALEDRYGPHAPHRAVLWPLVTRLPVMESSRQRSHQARGAASLPRHFQVGRHARGRPRVRGAYVCPHPRSPGGTSLKRAPSIPQCGGTFRTGATWCL